MHTAGDSERTHDSMEQAYRQADHYARVAARLLYDGREADARHYAARYARAATEAHQLRTLVLQAIRTEWGLGGEGQADQQDNP